MQTYFEALFFASRVIFVLTFYSNSLTFLEVAYLLCCQVLDERLVTMSVWLLQISSGQLCFQKDCVCVCGGAASFNNIM